MKKKKILHCEAGLAQGSSTFLLCVRLWVGSPVLKIIIVDIIISPCNKDLLTTMSWRISHTVISLKHPNNLMRPMLGKLVLPLSLEKNGKCQVPHSRSQGSKNRLNIVTGLHA